jgi:DNA-binding IclR family transcriptional regulator
MNIPQASMDIAPDDSSTRAQRGIQSVEVGGQLLLALAEHGRAMALKDLAREAGMPPAKAHPYLVSFVKLGLIEQQPATGRYGLGPLALQLGLISLQQFDPLRLASERIADLATSLGQTIALAVWGNRGPAVVRIEYAPSPVHVAMRHGMVMSLTARPPARYLQPICRARPCRPP